MAGKYLDDDGVVDFWGRITEYVNQHGGSIEGTLLEGLYAFSVENGHLIVRSTGKVPDFYLEDGHLYARMDDSTVRDLGEVSGPGGANFKIDSTLRLDGEVLSVRLPVKVYKQDEYDPNEDALAILLDSSDLFCKVYGLDLPNETDVEFRLSSGYSWTVSCDNSTTIECVVGKLNSSPLIRRFEGSFIADELTNKIGLETEEDLDLSVYLEDQELFPKATFTLRYRGFALESGSGGQGVPTGGTTGQILGKKSDEDLDTEWIDPPATGVTSFKGRTGAITPEAGDYTAAQVGARPNTWTPSASDVGAVPTSRTIDGKALSGNINILPTGGSTGQVLAKSSSTNYAVQWITPSLDGDYLPTSGGTINGKLIIKGNLISGNGVSGSEVTAHNYYGICLTGTDNVIDGLYGVAIGVGLIVHSKEYVIGKNNVDSSTRSSSVNDLFAVGKGTGRSNRANAFRVSEDGVYGTAAFKSSGADYAEMFEWEDGNPNGEDRVGRFVTLHGEKISLAGPGDDFILGIVSGNPTIVGDDHEDQWHKMFATDIFGRPIYEEVEAPEELDSEGNVIQEAHVETQQKVNPDYNHTEKYVGRQDRKEWDAVGMLGKLVMVDDGTCQVDGWCRPFADGIATNSVERTPYRVIKRIDETHIRVLIMAR